MYIMNKTVLDTNVIIDVLEKPGVAETIRCGLRGKSIKLVVCEMVLHELKRVRAWSRQRVVDGLESAFGKKRILVSTSPADIKDKARLIRYKFELAHAGDDCILAQCQMYGWMLLTRDRKMRMIATVLGILAFSPQKANEL